MLYDTREKCAAYVDERCPLPDASPFMREKIRELMIDLAWQCSPTKDPVTGYLFERDELGKFEPRVSHAINNVIKVITDWVPSWTLRTQKPGTTALIEAVERPWDLVGNIVFHIAREADFYPDKQIPLGTTNYRITQNHLKLTGHSWDEYLEYRYGREVTIQTIDAETDEVVSEEVETRPSHVKIRWKRPADLKDKLSPKELVQTFLKDTPFCSFLLMPVADRPFRAPTPDTYYSGVWIIAPQGKGKTNLLREMVFHKLKQECSVLLFDSKGDLADSFRSRDVGREVVTIDPHPYLSLNPLDLGTHSVSTLMYLFNGLLDAKFTTLQLVLFRNAIFFASLIPDANMTIFRDIISNGPGKYPDALASLDEEDRAFWDDDFPTSTYKDTRQQILWRLNLLRPSGTMARTMFNAPKTLVRMAPLMDRPTLTIINNSVAHLDPLQSEFFGRLFLVMILGAAEQRALLPEDKKLPCHVFIDEAQTIIARETGVADIIQRCRSQKISLRCAHHSLSQLEHEKVVSALGDCAVKYTSSDSDAPKLAPFFGCTAEDIRSLAVGQFIIAARGIPGFQRCMIPMANLDQFPLLSKAQIAARDAEMVRRYHYTPASTTPKATKPAPEDDPWGDKPVI